MHSRIPQFEQTEGQTAFSIHGDAWKRNGVLEYWSTDLHITPSLHHSIAPVSLQVIKCNEA
jgi:hypothetical protein